VVLPGVEGYFGVKANHVPYIAQLKAGVVELHDGASLLPHSCLLPPSCCCRLSAGVAINAAPQGHDELSALAAGRQRPGTRTGSSRSGCGAARWL
jgi:hypothetical protein